MYFLRNVAMWPTDFMVTVSLSSKSWKLYIRLYSGNIRDNVSAKKTQTVPQLQFLNATVFALHPPFQKEGDSH